jgi:excisionase family DNA binding protein
MNITPPQPDVEHEPLVYSLEEAADLLKVSKWTINRLIEEGEIGSILIRSRRLVRASDLTDFIDRQTMASAWGSNASR